MRYRLTILLLLLTIPVVGLIVANTVWRVTVLEYDEISGQSRYTDSVLCLAPKVSISNTNLGDRFADAGISWTPSWGTASVVEHRIIGFSRGCGSAPPTASLARFDHDRLAFATDDDVKILFDAMTSSNRDSKEKAVIEFGLKLFR